MAMQFQLIGYSHYGFTADNGKYLEGYKFHVARPSASRDFKGMEVAALSVSENIVQACGEPVVGKTYAVTYDQKGRVVSYQMSPVAPSQSPPRQQ